MYRASYGRKGRFISNEATDTVKIPVGATNIDAALVIVNSTPKVSDYFRVPRIDGREPQFKVVTKNDTESYECSFETEKYDAVSGTYSIVIDTDFNNREFAMSGVPIEDEWMVRKLDRPYK